MHAYSAAALLCCASLAALASPAAPGVPAQGTPAPDGAALFQAHCAVCHTGAADSRAPILAALPHGRSIIVIGQKSGSGWALDPDKQGEVRWQYHAGAGSALGGIEWGSATDAEHAYFAVSDIFSAAPGGLHAVNLQSGVRAWFAPPQAPTCAAGPRCNAAQAAAISVIPGAVFSGSNDGTLRAHSTVDGTILWQVDTEKEFTTVNGVPAKGASMLGPGPVIAGAMVYVPSGYGGFGGRAGNVLLAYGLPGTAK